MQEKKIFFIKIFFLGFVLQKPIFLCNKTAKHKRKELFAKHTLKQKKNL